MKTPQRLGILFKRYKQLKDWTNNKKQKKLSALFGCILKTVFASSDAFCLITSQIINPTHVWMHSTLRSRTRNVFGVQLYRNNALALLSRILSIVNSDWLQRACSVHGVYEMWWINSCDFYAYINVICLQHRKRGVKPSKCSTRLS